MKGNIDMSAATSDGGGGDSVSDAEAWEAVHEEK